MAVPCIEHFPDFFTPPVTGKRVDDLLGSPDGSWYGITRDTDIAREEFTNAKTWTHHRPKRLRLPAPEAVEDNASCSALVLTLW